MEQTRFEKFKENARGNYESYLEDMKNKGSFSYAAQCDELIKLQRNISSRLLIYLFGEQLGMHLIQKFLDSGRNLLTFIGSLNGEYKIFLLHELRSNESLFAYT